MSGIDGISGSSQLGDFLAIATVLADPSRVADEYKKLAEVKAEAQRVIDLAGPANEILAIREEIQRLKDSAQTALDDANRFAKKLTADAGIRASDLLADAQSKAENIIKNANDLLASTQDVRAKADKAISEAAEAKRVAEQTLAKRGAEFDQKMAELDGAMLSADAEKENADKVRQKLLAVAAQLAEALGEVAAD